MGGKSSSSVSNYTETTEFGVQGPVSGNIITGSGNTVLDGGAIEAMRQTAEGSTALASQNILSMAALTEKLTKQSSDASAKTLVDALNFSSRASNEALSFAHAMAQPDSAATQQFIKMLPWIVGGSVAAWLILGGRR